MFGNSPVLRVGGESSTTTAADRDCALASAVVAVKEALPRMRADMCTGRVEPFFPIFINRQTDSLASHGNHLFSVREGEQTTKTALAVFPFVFVADLGRALARCPLTIYRQAVAGRDYYTRQQRQGVGPTR